MAIEKINFSYPKGTLQSVYDTETVTALELASKTSKKVDECVDIVNGVEQTSIQARAIVDDMQLTQEQFVIENNDARTQLITDNQAFIDTLNTSKTTFETNLNNSKTTFENNMTNAVSEIISTSDELVQDDVNAKITALINDGTIESLINDTIIGGVNTRIDATELSNLDSTGYGVINGLTILQQSSPNMSVLISTGIAHLYNGKRIVQNTNATFGIDTADTLYPRKDIIYIASNGIITYGKGTASATPVAPSPVNALILAEIYVGQSATSIVAANITDKRIIKKDVPSLVSDFNTHKADYGQDIGTANNYKINLTPSPVAYEIGKVYRFKALNSNTGVSTFQIGSLAVLPIKKNVTSDLESGDIAVNQIVSVVYDGTNCQLISLGVSNGSITNPKLSSSLKDDLIYTILNEPRYIKTLSTSLNNPFVKTEIKLVGDSIMAGQTGTGYSLTGEAMFTDTNSVVRVANINSATCTANMLRNYLLNKYAKDVIVEITNASITADPVYSVPSYDPNTIAGSKIVMPNGGNGSNGDATFSFYGDHFSIYYASTSVSGIVDVWVDGVKIGSIDTYQSVVTYKKKADFTGLTLAQHTVVLKQTNTKNGLSGGNSVYLEGVKIPKTVIVHNWSVSGIDSFYVYTNKANFFKSTDDIVIMMIGTNDRLKGCYNNLQQFLRLSCKYVKDTYNKPVILMSANPVSVDNDNNVAYSFKMDTVDATIKSIADELNLDFISNYESMTQYMLITGKTTTDILSDGLHPNDTGYNIMYQNMLHKLNI